MLIVPLSPTSAATEYKTVIFHAAAASRPPPASGGGRRGTRGHCLARKSGKFRVLPLVNKAQIR